MIAVQLMSQHVLGTPMFYYISTSVFSVMCNFVQNGDMKVVVFSSDYMYYPLDTLPSQADLDLFYQSSVMYLGLGMVSTKYVPIINNAKRVLYENNDG